MKKLFVVILTITYWLLTNNCKAQTPYVAIPDSNFVHYLKTIVPTAFKGDSLNTSSPLVTTTTQTISINNSSIANLSGVQYFTSLTSLYCDINSLTSLPSLPNTLTKLVCYQNSLSTLPSLPTSLTYLDCGHNHLTSLPTLPNSLQNLYCENNSLTSLPALPNSLQTLWCQTNSLTTLPALPNSLTYLDCSAQWNGSIYCLASLPVLPNSLTTLNCEANDIICFPVFPNSLNNVNILYNPNNCLPNYVLPAMNSYTTTPLCVAGNSNGCAVAGIKQYNINNEVKVYPNPANESLTLTLSKREGIYSISIYDMLGKLVMQHTYSPPSEGQGEALDVSDLSEGFYNLCVSTNEGIANKLVVIER